jgi:hypothetical protein
MQTNVAAKLVGGALELGKSGGSRSVPVAEVREVVAS